MMNGFNEPEYLLGIETPVILAFDNEAASFNEPEYLLGIETPEDGLFGQQTEVSMSQNTF